MVQDFVGSTRGLVKKYEGKISYLEQTIAELEKDKIRNVNRANSATQQLKEIEAKYETLLRRCSDR